MIYQGASSAHHWRYLGSSSLVLLLLSSTSTGSQSTRRLRLVFLRLQLLDDIVLVLLRKSHKLRMTSSGYNLFVLVDEPDGRKCQCLPNCNALATIIALNVIHAQIIHLSQTASPLITSPTFPPELKYVTLRSVETPVDHSPRDARTNEPPISTIEAIVPPCRMLRRLQ